MNRAITFIGLTNNYQATVRDWLNAAAPSVAFVVTERNNGREVVISLDDDELFSALSEGLSPNSGPENLYWAIFSPASEYEMPRFVRGKGYTAEEERIKKASSRHAGICVSASTYDLRDTRKRAR